MFRVSIFFFILFFVQWSHCQQSAICINAIIIKGNRITKEKVILRELMIKAGDTISMEDLPTLLEQSENNLYNIKLFNEVGINWVNNRGINTIHVDLQESWYIYPALIFELADRNFNVWWNEHNRARDRVNIGGRLDYINLSGHRDKAKVKVQLGYTEKYELTYTYPYLNESGTFGLSAGALYSRNNEVGYKTTGNKLEFYSSEEHIYKRLRLSTSINYRPLYKVNHSLKLEYYNNSISEEVIEEYNPVFYIGGRTDIKYLGLEYTFDYNNLNNVIYPLSGYYTRGSIRKEGLGAFDHVNLLSLNGLHEHYWQLNKKWTIGTRIKGRYQVLRDNPGYYHYTALGYGGDQLRGYEFYVIDGLDYIYSRNHIKWEILNKKWNLGRLMFIPQFRQLLARVYLVGSIDLGYVNSPYFTETNTLGNDALVGGGPGVHIIIYNNFLFRIEYSINRDYENGLFLHLNAGF